MDDYVDCKYYVILFKYFSVYERNFLGIQILRNTILVCRLRCHRYRIEQKKEDKRTRKYKDKSS